MTPGVAFDRDAVRIGITPTCWTNDDFPDLGEDISFEQCVSEMALAGFDGCSVGHKFPKDPHALRAALALRDLRVSEPWASTFFTVPGLREHTIRGFREQMAFIKAVGGDRVVVAELGHAVHQQDVALGANQPVLDEVSWKSMVEGLNELGAMAVAEGLILCYHPHMGTGVQTRSDVDRLLTGTDPELVHLLVDTGHFTWAGGDPVALIREQGHRVAHAHLKDLRRPVLERWQREDFSFRDAILAGIFTVPGDGMIEFEPILRALADSGFRGWLVVEAEQDPARAHPLTYAKKAREHLRTVAGI
jgi:inosose dehydratase